MLKSLVKQIPGARAVARLLGLASEDPRNFLLSHLPKNGVGAEIGVDRGDFSALILQQLHPTELHLIDPWEYQSDETYSSARYGGKAHNGQLEMDKRHDAVKARFAQSPQVTIHRAYSTDTLAKFPDAHFDWIYIDGNHLYEYVKQDLDLSLRKAKVGGLITGDDYGEGGWWEGGVKKAVDEFAKGDSAELIEIRNGQFIFRKLK